MKTICTEVRKMVDVQCVMYDECMYNDHCESYRVCIQYALRAGYQTVNIAVCSLS